MPPLFELEEYLQALRAYYAECEASPAEDLPGSRFERALAVLAGLDKAGVALRGLRAAVSSLRTPSGSADLLTPAALMALSRPQLEQALRPAGFSAAKAGRVRNLLEFLADKAAGAEQYGTSGASPATAVNTADPRGTAGKDTPGTNRTLLDDPSLSFLDAEDTATLREELLQVRGLGLESVDAILLLALERPVFAVNAQTWRLLRRHGFVGEEAEYAEMQGMFSALLPEDAALYRESYFLLRRLVGEFCRAAAPRCAACPLGAYMEYEPCE